jgi:hypothetical protein
MSSESGILSWDIDAISNALKIPSGDVQAYFTDGRRISFVLELINTIYP